MKIAFWIWLIGAVAYLIYLLLDDESDLSPDEQTPGILKPVIAVFWFFSAPVQLFSKWQMKKAAKENPS